MPTAEARTPAPTYGTIRELEQPLHRAVLASGPCSTGKHDVETQARSRRRCRPSSDRLRSIVSSGSSAGYATMCACRPPRTGCDDWTRACSMTSEAASAIGGRSGDEPAPVLLDADRNRLEPIAIEMLEDRGRRRDRDLVLAGAAAVDDADAKFLHVGRGLRPQDAGAHLAAGASVRALPCGPTNIPA